MARCGIRLQKSGSVGGAVQRAAVILDLLGVLREGGGETAVALGVRDEVEIVALGRGDGGFERGYAGVANGARRQTGVAIGVVGRVELKVGGVDGTSSEEHHV